MAQLPILYRTRRRSPSAARPIRNVLKRCARLRTAKSPSDLVEAIGSSQPFFLAYQGYNDRDLQRLYGSLVCRIMAGVRFGCSMPTAAIRRAGAARYCQRVLSAAFRLKVPIRGWLSQFDRRQFQIFCYYTGVKEDPKPSRHALCDGFVQGPLSIDGWRQAIFDDAPHVLIYPEVGMDAISAQLAAHA